MTDTASTETATEQTDAAPITAETTVETPATVSKSEHDAAMAKMRLELKEAKDRAKRADELEAEKLTATEKAEKAAQDAKAEAEAARAELAQAKLDAMRTRIGAEVGLPADIAELLKGDDEDALRAHATRLLAAIPKTDAPGARPAGSDQPSAKLAQIREAMGLK